VTSRKQLQHEISNARDNVKSWRKEADSPVKAARIRENEAIVNNRLAELARHLDKAGP
jgi:hypothetical protein